MSEKLSSEEEGKSFYQIPITRSGGVRGKSGRGKEGKIRSLGGGGKHKSQIQRNPLWL